jgi:hypothetical protein
MNLYATCTNYHLSATILHYTTPHDTHINTTTTAQQQQQGGAGAIGSAIGSGGLPGYGSVDPLGRELPVGAYGSSAGEQQLYGDGQGRLSAEQAAKLELFTRQRRAAQVYTANTTIYECLTTPISVLHMHNTIGAQLQCQC